MFKMFLITLVLTVFTFADGQVLKTGQTISYDTDGNVVTDGSVKDDGFYQMGKARSYSRSAAGIVTDLATGLEWQDDVDFVQKPNDASGGTAITYCSDLTLDGGGWRLPSIEEMATLVDNGKYNSSVTDGVFQHFSSSYYWSSTTYADDSSSAWFMSFSYGYSGSLNKTYDNYVRCVRGGQLETSNFSRDDATEIVTDSTTGLQWQDNEIVKTTTRRWKTAIDYCENDMTLGGHNDWRLPNKKELLSIVDRSRYYPSLDMGTFKNVSEDYYWSSTTYALFTDYAWSVYFINGYPDHNDKTNDYYVRCVRGGQFDNSASLPSIIMYLLN